MRTRGRDSFVVEFVGLPGAGKSTLSHAVADLLRARGERVSEPSYELTRRSAWLWKRLEKLRYAGSIALAHPLWTAATLRRIRATRQQSVHDLLATSFNLLFVCGLLARFSREPGIHLMDQGFFHALWSIDFSACSPKGLADVRVQARGGAMLIPADLIVMVDVPSETAVSRMTARSGTQSRLEFLIPTPGFERHLDAALSALERLRNRLDDLQRRCLPLAVEHLADDGRRTLESNARWTAERILRARDRALEPALSSGSPALDAAGPALPRHDV